MTPPRKLAENPPKPGGLLRPSPRDAEAIEALPSEPFYFTVEDVAALLRVSTKSVYRAWKTDPTMPALKFGGTLRFPRERLLRWLRAGEQGRPGTIHRIRKPMRSAANSAPAQERDSA